MSKTILGSLIATGIFAAFAFVGYLSTPVKVDNVFVSYGGVPDEATQYLQGSPAYQFPYPTNVDSIIDDIRDKHSHDVVIMALTPDGFPLEFNLKSWDYYELIGKDPKEVFEKVFQTAIGNGVEYVSDLENMSPGCFTYQLVLSKTSRVV